MVLQPLIVGLFVQYFLFVILYFINISFASFSLEAIVQKGSLTCYVICGWRIKLFIHRYFPDVTIIVSD